MKRQGAMVELEGNKVILRALERGDCRELWEACEPAEPLPTEPLNPGLSLEGADRWFEEMQRKQGREQVYLGIFTPEGRLVGDIQLAHVDWRHRTATIGLGIARRADRGQGHGTDATWALLCFAFEHFDLQRVGAATAEYNAAARRIWQRCGFAEEGCERQAVYCGGRRWTRPLYGPVRAGFEGRVGR